MTETPETTIRRKLFAARLDGVPLRRCQYGVEASNPPLPTSSVSVPYGDATVTYPPGTCYVAVRDELARPLGCCALGAVALGEPVMNANAGSPHAAAARALGETDPFGGFASGVLRGFDGTKDPDPRMSAAAFSHGFHLGALRRLLTPHHGHLGLTRCDYGDEIPAEE